MLYKSNKHTNTVLGMLVSVTNNHRGGVTFNFSASDGAKHFVVLDALQWAEIVGRTQRGDDWQRKE